MLVFCLFAHSFCFFLCFSFFLLFFFFNDTATTEIYTLSLHDALPIFVRKKPQVPNTARQAASFPGDISRGKRSSMSQPKTRPDSPVPSLQGPCDRSLKSEVPCGSCLNWRPGPLPMHQTQWSPERPLPPDRKSVVYGKSVDLGGRRIIKKKKKREVSNP